MGVRDVDLNSEEWCDLVFEERNKEYGAYYLRKTSTVRHLFALSSVMAAAIVILLVLKMIQFNRTQYLPDYEYQVKAIELSSLIDLEEYSNNNQIQVKPEEKPDLKEIATFAPPIIAQDESVVQDLKELQEINLSSDSIDASSGWEEDQLLLRQRLAQLNKEEGNEIAATNKKNREAEFQDGKTALLRYIYQNIHYPPAALKQRINGRVICSFIVNEDGSLSDITLVQGVYIFLDEEVLRVIGSMPLWKPAMRDGEPIKVKYIMPVVFRLN